MSNYFSITSIIISIVSIFALFSLSAGLILIVLILTTIYLLSFLGLRYDEEMIGVYFFGVIVLFAFPFFIPLGMLILYIGLWKEYFN